MNRRPYLLATLLPTPVVMQLATLFGAGRFPKGPGTIGSLVGILWYALIFTQMGSLVGWIILALSVVIAVGICDEAARRLRVEDPSCVVIDEGVAIPFCFLGLEGLFREIPAWPYVVLGFLLFRLFDISKPLFIGWLDRLGGGIGIVADDLAAALVTCAILHGIHWHGGLDRWLGIA